MSWKEKLFIFIAENPFNSSIWHMLVHSLSLGFVGSIIEMFRVKGTWRQIFFELFCPKPHEKYIIDFNFMMYQRWNSSCNKQHNQNISNKWVTISILVLPPKAIGIFQYWNWKWVVSAEWKIKKKFFINSKNSPAANWNKYFAMLLCRENEWTYERMEKIKKQMENIYFPVSIENPSDGWQTEIDAVEFQ